MSKYFSRKCSAFLCGLLWLSAANGQDFQRFRFGVQLSPVLTWLKSDRQDEVSPEKIRVGLNVGLTTDYYFAKHYAFASGIALFMTGGTLRYRSETELKTNSSSFMLQANSDVLYKLQYVTVPAGIKMNTPTIGRFKYYVDLGFDPMIRVRAKSDFSLYDASSATHIFHGNVNVKRNTRLFALGYHIGGGLCYPIGGDAAVIGGFSFMNMFTGMTKDHSRITSNHILLRIGMSF
ncbi:MAG: PorT family protein [Bacteroidales bacterium]|jgi:hypothetical protein|nr:PorT family protein [Bacteroidales bacterium]